MRLLELRQKEVINIRTCASLGCVMDLLINEKNGCILALISKFFSQSQEILTAGIPR